MNYYELVYFYNRKNSGSYYVESEKCRDKFIGEDEFLDYLVNVNQITYQEAQQVIEINCISKDEYESYTSE